ncbi:hypothetical protein AAW51_4851 [Caldimonas brevitalea]|uniref:Uncharacterized protein n=1 Tax=Caldimonas brevitalea TaxID=413882 RepID=A0A0G3BQ47_9BURK|nr:hypothetical protein AAW51_4851 [Caldimonas brevitalea]
MFIRKLLVFAVTSGLAGKLWKVYRQKHATAGMARAGRAR